VSLASPASVRPENHELIREALFAAPKRSPTAASPKPKKKDDDDDDDLTVDDMMWSLERDVQDFNASQAKYQPKVENTTEPEKAEVSTPKSSKWAFWKKNKDKLKAPAKP